MVEENHKDKATVLQISKEALQMAVKGKNETIFVVAVVKDHLLFQKASLSTYTGRAKSDTSTTILINLCAALSLLNLTFLMNEWLSSMGNQVICNIIAATMHYSLLCTFTWFGIKAFYFYYLIIKLSTTEIKKIWMKMGAVGWGMPAVVVIILGGLKKYGEYKIYKEEGGTVSMCWITDPVVHYITNIGYYALVFSFTVVIFTVVSVKIFHMRKSNPRSAEGSKKNAFTLLGLAFVLGITWGVMFFNVGPLQVPSFYVFTILNSLQGFFIFLWYYNSSSAAKAIDQPSEKSSHSGISNTTYCNPYDSTASKSSMARTLQA
ncbi:UNVERIFIED_CONTAM: hypothetical protein FKN15_028915 [Acipenser sinensis]